MTIRLLAGLLLAALGAAPTLAQTPRPAAKAAPAPTATQPAPDEATMQTRADALTAGMAQGLGLTPAQTEKVRAINLRSVRSVETARQRYRQEPAKLKGAVEDVGMARLEQLKDVLSPNQFARYQQKREQRMGVPSMSSNQGTPPPGLSTGNRGDE